MFKKGDKVYSILRGWGEITRIYSEKNMIGVMFGGSYEIYERNGKKNTNDLIPELYHTEPTITVPKRRVDHKGWIAVDNEPDADGNRNCSMVVNEKNKDRLILADNLGLNRTLNPIIFYTEE